MFFGGKPRFNKLIIILVYMHRPNIEKILVIFRRSLRYHCGREKREENSCKSSSCVAGLSWLGPNRSNPMCAICIQTPLSSGENHLLYKQVESRKPGGQCYYPWLWEGFTKHHLFFPATKRCTEEWCLSQFGFPVWYIDKTNPINLGTKPTSNLTSNWCGKLQLSHCKQLLSKITSHHRMPHRCS